MTQKVSKRLIKNAGVPEGYVIKIINGVPQWASAGTGTGRGTVDSAQLIEITKNYLLEIPETILPESDGVYDIGNDSYSLNRIYLEDSGLTFASTLLRESDGTLFVQSGSNKRYLKPLDSNFIESVIDSAYVSARVQDNSAQGAQGIQGPQGSTGVQGNLGEDLQGVQGFQGLTGFGGSRGNRGFCGVQGPPGDVGDGIQGAQGVQGDSGPQGTFGLRGSQGASGDDGYTGVQGIQGLQGVCGLQGVSGEVGEEGAQGAQGLCGFTGLQGLQGFQGVCGPDGTAGTQGAQGPQGFSGAEVAGSNGAQGATGFSCTVQGSQGPQGFDVGDVSINDLSNASRDANHLGVGVDLLQCCTDAASGVVVGCTGEGFYRTSIVSVGCNCHTDGLATPSCLVVEVGFNNTQCSTTGVSCSVIIGASNTENNNARSNIIIGYNNVACELVEDNVIMGNNNISDGCEDVIMGNFNSVAQLTKTRPNVTIGNFNCYCGDYNVVMGNGPCAVGVLSQSVFLGDGAGLCLSSASCTVAVGTNALGGFGGTPRTMVCSTAIGANAGSNISSAENVLILGSYSPTGVVNNTVFLGHNNTCRIRSPLTSISALSDCRDKTCIQDLEYGLDFVKAMRPVQFCWNRRDQVEINPGVDIGFIAQELEQVEEQFNSKGVTRLVGGDSDRKEADTFRSYPIVIKAVQELQKQINRLKDDFQSIKSS